MSIKVSVKLEQGVLMRLKCNMEAVRNLPLNFLHAWTVTTVFSLPLYVLWNPVVAISGVGNLD